MRHCKASRSWLCQFTNSKWPALHSIESLHTISLLHLEMMQTRFKINKASKMVSPLFQILQKVFFPVRSNWGFWTDAVATVSLPNGHGTEGFLGVFVKCRQCRHVKVLQDEIFFKNILWYCRAFSFLIHWRRGFSDCSLKASYYSELIVSESTVILLPMWFVWLHLW